MSEIISSHDQDFDTPAALPPDTEALEKAAGFLRREIPVLCKITGLTVDVQVGKGWATDLNSGNFTIDPAFFLEKGYTPEHSAYAALHELLAHVRDVKRDPVAAARQRAFAGRGPAEHLFGNILSDIQGNRLMHRLLPRQADIAADIYATKLFPLDSDGQPVDYAAKPLHIQFLFKMIRQAMIPDSDTPVRPEVDAALDGLRDYKGSGYDIIDHLTRPDLKVSGSDRFDSQLAIIYPVYLALLEQAAKEKAEQMAEEPAGEGQPTGNSADQSDQNDGDPAGSSGASGSDAAAAGDPFAADYDDYFANKHPEPLDEEQKKALDEMIRRAAENERSSPAPPNPIRALDKKLRAATGFGLNEHQAYAAEVARHRQAIDAMREVYRSVISERVARRRGLSRTAYREGDLLHPDRLAQVVIDKTAGMHEPEAFARYERVAGRTELVGKTDYIFVFDRSSSMAGGKSEAAAASALIMLEALAGMERDIQAAEEQYDIELGLDIRTALYTFNDGADCVKPLSQGLSDAERLSVRRSIKQPRGGTADYLALQDIAALEPQGDRQRVVVVVSDGKSKQPNSAREVIKRLRAQGTLVYGVGIGSDAATTLYAPEGKRVDNPEDLPDVLQSFIQQTLST